jgi:hypothetical protein
MPAFEAWARTHPAIEIVISSTRRQIFPFETIRGFFSADMRDRIIGTTPIVVVEAQHKRYREIGIWLAKNNRETTPWVALDDSADRFPPGCPTGLHRLGEPAPSRSGKAALFLRRLRRCRAGTATGFTPCGPASFHRFRKLAPTGCSKTFTTPRT